MKPQDIIAEVKKSFGAMAGRDLELEDLFWSVLYEVETVLRPADLAKWQIVTVTDTGSWYEYTFTSDILDVVRVQRGDLLLVNVPIEALLQLPAWTADGMFWAFDSGSKRLIVNRTTGGSVTSLRILVLEHTTRVASDQDLALLERIYPAVLAGLMLRVAELVNDETRLGYYAKKYASLVGLEAKEG